MMLLVHDFDQNMKGCIHHFMLLWFVDSVNLKCAIELLMTADSWPAGVFVKRYFKPKNGSD